MGIILTVRSVELAKNFKRNSISTAVIQHMWELSVQHKVRDVEW